MGNYTRANTDHNDPYADSFVFVVITNPRHGEVQPGFIPSLGDQIKIMIGCIHHVEPPGITRIGVMYSATFVLIEHAYSRRLLVDGIFGVHKPKRVRLAVGVIVVNSSLLELRWRKRYLKIKVEIAVEGRNPLETPTHTLLERLQLFQGSMRNGNHRHVTVI